jgi:hypothetical protein
VVWFCRECGAEVSSPEELLVVSIGWTALDGDSGICSPCGRKGGRKTSRLLRPNSRALPSADGAPRVTRSQRGAGPYR